MQAVDGAAGEAEHGRQQAQGGGHHGQDGQDGADGEAVEVPWPTRNNPKQRDDHRGPGEEHGAPRRGHGPDHGVPGDPSLPQPLTVAGDDEQGVVDPDAEADHGHQLGAEARIDQQMTDQRHHPVPGPHPGQGGEDRQAHGHHRAEGHQHDDDGGGDPDRFAGPGDGETTALTGAPPRATCRPGSA